MVSKSFFQMAAKWLVIGALLGTGLAMAQAEPNMNQIYATAQSGNVDEAQAMIQQVLISHPKSAKAYFVQAELYSRQGKLERARESLATAEKFSPGLAFAKPDAVQALRSQLVVKSSTRNLANTSVNHAVSPPPSPSSSTWVLPLLLAGGVIVGGYFIFRKRNPEPYPQQPDYANQNGLNGPQNFGAGGSGTQQPAYPQPAYPQPGYPQQPGSGLGGRIMGGVATGLAVGAGVVAAEAIGRSLMGGHNNGPAGQSERLSDNDYQPTNSNPDMGGAGFGINDTSSWDDGGGADAGGGGGGDWDN